MFKELKEGPGVGVWLVQCEAGGKVRRDTCRGSQMGSRLMSFS